MHSQVNRMNPMYNNMNHVNMNNQMNMYNYSQMNPISQYPPQNLYPQPTQYLMHNNFPQNISNNCTQENFSQNEENNINSFTQIVKNNIENGLKKMPENFSDRLIEKINGKFQKSNDDIFNFKKKLNESNNRIEKLIRKLPDCLQIVENELNEINIKLNKFKQLIENNKNLIEEEIKKKQECYLNQIGIERENEKKLYDYIDQIEILKFNITESIHYVQTEIKKNLNLKDQSFEEIRKLLTDKLKELNNEVLKIDIDKFPNKNATAWNEINVDSSVKKINELKTFINKIQNGKKIKEIKKESFSLLSDRNKENNINITNTIINNQFDNLDLYRKAKIKDISFYDL